MIKIVIASVASYAVGNIVGQYVTRRKIQRGISKAVDDFSGRMSAALGDMDRVITEARKAAVKEPPVDVLARGPLPVRPGDIDKALRDGTLAFYKPYDGDC